MRPAGEDGPELPRFGVGKRPGSRTHGLGEAGEDLGIGRIPDTPDVKEPLKLHARAIGKPLEGVLADSASDTLLGRRPRVLEMADVAALMASDRASAMAGVIANVTCGSIVD